MASLAAPEGAVSANEIVAEMVEAILTDRKPIFDEDGNRTEHGGPVFNSGDEVALMVNGLGGTPISNSISSTASPDCLKSGIKVWRSYVGNTASLEMAGMSIAVQSGRRAEEALRPRFRFASSRRISGLRPVIAFVRLPETGRFVEGPVARRHFLWSIWMVAACVAPEASRFSMATPTRQ